MPGKLVILTPPGSVDSSPGQGISDNFTCLAYFDGTTAALPGVGPSLVGLGEGGYIFSANSTYFSVLSSGLVLPVQTTTQRNAQASPPRGTVLYNSTSDRPEYFSAASGWLPFASGSGSGSAPLTLTGTTDTSQLVVIANGTQTSALAVFQNSSAAAILTINAIRTAAPDSMGQDAPGHVIIPAYGASYNSVSLDPPLTFAGSNKTGWVWHPIPDYPEQLFTSLNGRQIETSYYQTSSNQYHTIFAVDVVRPDIEASPRGTVILGHPTNGWTFVYSNGGFIFGNQTGNGEVAALVANGEDEGLYFNTTTGTYMGLNLCDPGASQYHRMNWQTSTTGWTQAFTDDAAVNSQNGFNYTLQAQNKTAGTGNGGDLIWAPGTSAGGNRGCVFLPVTSGMPSFTPSTHAGYAAIFPDVANSKIWVYCGSSWKFCALS